MVAAKKKPAAAASAVKKRPAGSSSTKPPKKRSSEVAAVPAEEAWQGGPEDGFFEGTEKRIEIDFAEGTNGSTLLSVDKAGWEEVVRLCKTTVISSRVTEEFTSFVLSESSLIVYPTKVIIKTCGRTVPLGSVDKCIELGNKVGLKPEWLCYSRKEFQAPEKQPAEHRGMEAEIATCRQLCNGVGDAYVLGPLSGEHWMLYNADFLQPDCNQRGDFTVDMMMYGLPAEVRDAFYTSEPEGSRVGAEAMTKKSGFGAIIKSLGGEIDDYCFHPCGYSANAHIKDRYMITHVTPEEGCSYASFETNFGCVLHKPVDGDVAEPLNRLIEQVLDVFKPEKFTMTLFIDAGALGAIGQAPFQAANASYRRTSRNSYHFEKDYIATVANYVRGAPQSPAMSPRSAP
eukprot:TRINITY_DN24336_c0_g1_i1.p1 TRINITY_DN24336_c0_g1~~TRINITY_DN24336_c0_g1_i1.p1  ORF type:complete len:400 (-),score=72.64 TRINITY_DN24336_c0_g1_i1:188-1387(-)